MTFEIQNLTKYTQLQNCFLQNSFKKPLPRSASTSKSTLYSRKCKRVKKKFRRFEVESANNYNFDTKDFVDCTPEFTYQPPLYFWQMHPLIDHQKNTFIPSYLIKERVKEKLTPLKNKSAILKYAKIHLTESAVLKRSQCGFIYLDLNDSALFSLLQFVEEIGIEIPSFLEEKEKIGAHIPVILTEEIASMPFDPNMLEKSYEFSIKGCFSTFPNSWEGIEKAWFLTIESTSLRHLREKCRLPSKIGGHDFTAVFGSRKSFSLFKEPIKEQSFLRINVAHLPA